jgi:hypothetical protein
MEFLTINDSSISASFTGFIDTNPPNSLNMTNGPAIKNMKMKPIRNPKMHFSTLVVYDPKTLLS